MNDLTSLEKKAPLCSVELTDRLLTLGMSTAYLIYCIEDGMFHFTLGDAINYLKEEFNYIIDPTSVKYDRESEALVMDIVCKPKDSGIRLITINYEFPNALNALTENAIEQVAVTVQRNHEVPNSVQERLNEAQAQKDNALYQVNDKVVVSVPLIKGLDGKTARVVGVGYIFEEGEEREYNVKFDNGDIRTVGEHQLSPVKE